MTIFVAIAAYRDADLANTIADCVAKARWPADLRFGLCRQYAPGDPPPPDTAPARLRRIDIDWRESEGACWARAKALSLWEGEEFLLQIDSHHRFAQDWDARLLAQFDASGEALPLLTTYAQGFDPAAGPPTAGLPTVMQLHRFTEESIPTFAQAPRAELRGGPPWRARFLSAHLIFTLGQFVADIPYDPELYFIGEEISLAVRAFTHGYTLLHPSEHIMWHEYSRRQRVMHWHDHQIMARDRASLAKVQQLLSGKLTGRFGLGSARGLAEYESYAGVDFARRHASSAARRGSEPPRSPPAGIGVAASRQWRIRIPIDRNALPATALDRPAFWYVGFHDAAGVEVARADADGAEIQRLCRSEGALMLERRFTSPRRPVRWTVQPADRRRRWLERVGGAVEDVHMIVEDRQ